MLHFNIIHFEWFQNVYECKRSRQERRERDDEIELKVGITNACSFSSMRSAFQLDISVGARKKHIYLYTQNYCKFPPQKISVFRTLNDSFYIHKIIFFRVLFSHEFFCVPFDCANEWEIWLVTANVLAVITCMCTTVITAGVKWIAHRPRHTEWTGGREVWWYFFFHFELTCSKNSKYASYEQKREMCKRRNFCLSSNWIEHYWVCFLFCSCSVFVFSCVIHVFSCVSTSTHIFRF